jgi:hypothetical protein
MLTIELCTQPGDGVGDALRARSRLADLRHMSPRRIRKQSDQDLIANERAEELRVDRL